MNNQQTPRRKILVIDDEKVMLTLVTRVLNRGNFDVELLTAGSVREGIELIEGHDLALLVTDMSLPDGRGIELIRRFRAKFKTEPIIVMSGSLSIESEVDAIAGANVLACIQKPFTLDVFHSAVANALKLPGSNS